jgi:cell division protein FtsQ
MWNNTRLLNLLANLMFVLAALIIAKLVIIACLNSSRFPLRTVRFGGDMARVSPEQLADAFAGRAIGNFFAVDLGEVRRWVEAVPWVRHATIRRVWPDRLDVRLEAHHVLARWSDRELVNTYGEAFVAEAPEPLPRFAGPTGTELEVADRYHRFCDILAPIQQLPLAVVLTPRFAWEVRLTSGTSVALGRDGQGKSVEDRLARFVQIYPEAVSRVGPRLGSVDMRYPNGFAVRLLEQPAQPKDAPRGNAPKTPPRTAKPAKHALRGEFLQPALRRAA